MNYKTAIENEKVELVECKHCHFVKRLVHHELPLRCEMCKAFLSFHYRED